MPETIFGNCLGGINYTIPPYALPQYFLADAQNILPILTGYAAQRNGSSIINSGEGYGTLITSFQELIVNGTSNKFAAQGTVIGKFSSGTSKFVNHITGLTNGLYGQWINYGDYAIYANGIDNVKKTDGTTGSDLTAHLSGLTGGNCLNEWGERVWVSIGGTLYGSALRAPTDFNTTTTDSGYWSGTIGSNNQDITGLVSFFDMQLIGKLNQIWQLTGAPETASSTFRLTPLQTKDKDSLGFTSKNAIVQVGNDLLFLDGYTIKALSGVQAYGDVESVSIVGNIRDFLMDSSGAGIDKDYLQYSDFFHYKKKEQVYCSIPTSSTTRYWFVIDYSNQEMRKAIGLPKYSFFPLTGLHPTCFGGVENGSVMDIYAGCNDGFVRKLDTGYDDESTAVTSYATWCYGNATRNVQPVSILLSVRGVSGMEMTPYYAMGLQDWQQVRTSGNYTALATEYLGTESWRVNNNTGYKKINSFYMNTDKTFCFKLYHSKAGEGFEMRDSTFAFRLKQRYLG